MEASRIEPLDSTTAIFWCPSEGCKLGLVLHRSKEPPRPKGWEKNESAVDAAITRAQQISLGDGAWMRRAIKGGRDS